MHKPQSSGAAMHASLTPFGCENCKLANLCIPSLINDADRSALSSLITHRIRGERGTSLFRTGDIFDNIYLIRLGQFKALEQDHLGIDVVTGFHMPGASLGWDGIATGRFQSHAVALENCEVCVLPFAKLEALLAERPQLQQQVTRMLSQRLVNASRRALYASRRFLDARLAAFIVRMSQRHAKAGFSPSIFQLRMSRLDLCSYLGTSSEALSRLIATFKRNGWIRVTQREFEILAPDELERLASGHQAENARAPLPKTKRRGDYQAIQHSELDQAFAS